MSTRLLASLILPIALLSLSLAPPVDSASSDDTDDRRAKREIKDLEAQFVAAVIKADRSFFERVLAGDFTHTSHSGAFKTKAQWLAEPQFADTKTEPSPPRSTYDSYVVDDQTIRIYGSTAVVTGRTSPKGRTAQGLPISGQYRFLRIWVKQKGGWRAVAFQGTRIAQP